MNLESYSYRSAAELVTSDMAVALAVLFIFLQSPEGDTLSSTKQHLKAESQSPILEIVFEIFAEVDLLETAFT